VTADGKVAQGLLAKKMAKDPSEPFLKGAVFIQVTDLSPEGKKSLFAVNFVYKPPVDVQSKADDKDVETQAEIVGEIYKDKLELILHENRPQSPQNNPLKAKIESVSSSGELRISFSNPLLLPDANSLKILSSKC